MPERDIVTPDALRNIHVIRHAGTGYLGREFLVCSCGFTFDAWSAVMVRNRWNAHVLTAHEDPSSVERPKHRERDPFYQRSADA